MQAAQRLRLELEPADERGAPLPAPPAELPAAVDRASAVITRALDMLVIAGSGICLAAWLVRTGWTPSWVLQMKANTALSLLCAGAATYQLHRGRGTSSARALAGIAIAISVATVIEYASGAELGIDELFVRERLSTAVIPGRMGSNTAVALVAIGISQVLYRRDPDWTRHVSEGATVVAWLVALLALIGHVFGVATLYAVAAHTQMAPHTALLLLALSTSVLLGNPTGKLATAVLAPGTGGFMARRLMPVVLAVPILVGWATLQGVRTQTFDASFASSLHALLAIVVLSAVVLGSSMRLNRIDELRARGDREIRILNETLIQRAKLLEEANQELEAFSYSVSHDLRAPIRHIGGFTELLAKRITPSLDEQGRHYLDNISGGARRAGELIDDLLQFSRIGRSELRRVTVDMNRCFEQAWRELEPDRENRNVTFHLGVLPAVRGDSEMLALVARNLLSNALKYSRTRKHALIEIRADDAQGDAVIHVCDNGVGFDMRYVDKLFGVFQRLHSPDEFEGVGIGLANVKRIVQKHGGRVWADGRLDQGATFSFSIPKDGAAA